MPRRIAKPTPKQLATLGKRDPAWQREQREASFRKVIRSIPKGKVATYSQVAAAAGYPMYHRQVAQFLRNSEGALPWQRVVGSGGEIKLRYEMALEQRTRLEFEGVRFHGRKIDMATHQHQFRTWELD